MKYIQGLKPRILCHLLSILAGIEKISPETNINTNASIDAYYTVISITSSFEFPLRVNLIVFP